MHSRKYPLYLLSRSTLARSILTLFYPYPGHALCLSPPNSPQTLEAQIHLLYYECTQNLQGSELDSAPPTHPHILCTLMPHFPLGSTLILSHCLHCIHLLHSVSTLTFSDSVYTGVGCCLWSETGKELQGLPAVATPGCDVLHFLSQNPTLSHSSTPCNVIFLLI